MKEILTFMLLFLSGCSALVAGGGDKDASITVSNAAAIEKAVLEVNTRMTKALQELNPEKMFESILEGGPGCIIQNGRLMENRQAALDAVKAGLQGVAKAERTYDHTYVTVLAPDLALLTGDGTASVTLADGRVISRPFAVTSLFALKNGQWKLLHGHHSIPAAQ